MKTKGTFLIVFLLLLGVLFASVSIADQVKPQITREGESIKLSIKEGEAGILEGFGFVIDTEPKTELGFYFDYTQVSITADPDVKGKILGQVLNPPLQGRDLLKISFPELAGEIKVLIKDLRMNGYLEAEEIEVLFASKEPAQKPEQKLQKPSYNPRNMTRKNYLAIIDWVSQKTGFKHRDVLLALLDKESNWAKNAANVRGIDGEKGAWQIMPAHLQEHKKADGSNYNLDEPLDCCFMAVNVLRKYLVEADGDWEETILLWSTRDGQGKIKQYREGGYEALSFPVKRVLYRFTAAHQRAKAIYPSKLVITFQPPEPVVLVKAENKTGEKEKTPEKAAPEKVVAEDTKETVVGQLAWRTVEANLSESWQSRFILGTSTLPKKKPEEITISLAEVGKVFKEVRAENTFLRAQNEELNTALQGKEEKQIAVASQSEEEVQLKAKQAVRPLGPEKPRELRLYRVSRD